MKTINYKELYDAVYNNVKSDVSSAVSAAVAEVNAKSIADQVMVKIRQFKISNEKELQQVLSTKLSELIQSAIADTNKRIETNASTIDLRNIFGQNMLNSNVWKKTKSEIENDINEIFQEFQRSNNNLNNVSGDMQKRLAQLYMALHRFQKGKITEPIDIDSIIRSDNVENIMSFSDDLETLLYKIYKIDDESDDASEQLAKIAQNTKVALNAFGTSGANQFDKIIAALHNVSPEAKKAFDELRQEVLNGTKSYYQAVTQLDEIISVPSITQQDFGTSVIAKKIGDKWGKEFKSEVKNKISDLPNTLKEMLSAGGITFDDMAHDAEILNIDDDLLELKTALLDISPMFRSILEFDVISNWNDSVIEFHNNIKQTNAYLTDTNNLVQEESALLLRSGKVVDKITQQGASVNVGDALRRNNNIDSIVHTHGYNPLVDNLRLSDADIKELINENQKQIGLICGDDVLRIDLSSVAPKLISELKTQLLEIYQIAYASVGAEIQNGKLINLDKLPNEAINKATSIIHSLSSNIVNQFGGMYEILHVNNGEFEDITQDRIAQLTSEQIKEVNDAASKLITQSKLTTQQVQDSHSPSKVAEALGGDWGTGYANGILQTKDDVKNAVSELVSTGKMEIEDIADDWINIVNDKRLTSLKEAVSEVFGVGFEYNIDEMIPSSTIDTSKSQIKQLEKELSDANNIIDETKIKYDYLLDTSVDKFEYQDVLERLDNANQEIDRLNEAGSDKQTGKIRELNDELLTTISRLDDANAKIAIMDDELTHKQSNVDELKLKLKNEKQLTEALNDQLLSAEKLAQSEKERADKEVEKRKSLSAQIKENERWETIQVERAQSQQANVKNVELEIDHAKTLKDIYNDIVKLCNEREKHASMIATYESKNAEYQNKGSKYQTISAIKRGLVDNGATLRQLINDNASQKDIENVWASIFAKSNAYWNKNNGHALSNDKLSELIGFSTQDIEQYWAILSPKRFSTSFNKLKAEMGDLFANSVSGMNDVQKAEATVYNSLIDFYNATANARPVAEQSIASLASSFKHLVSLNPDAKIQDYTELSSAINTVSDALKQLENQSINTINKQPSNKSNKNTNTSKTKAKNTGIYTSDQLVDAVFNNSSAKDKNALYANMANELSQIEGLKSNVDLVTKSVQQKNNAFIEEKNIVEQSVVSEIEYLNQLNAKITEIAQNITSIPKININEKIDYESLSEHYTAALNSLNNGFDFVEYTQNLHAFINEISSGLNNITLSVDATQIEQVMNSIPREINVTLDTQNIDNDYLKTLNNSVSDALNSNIDKLNKDVNNVTLSISEKTQAISDEGDVASQVIKDEIEWFKQLNNTILEVANNVKNVGTIRINKDIATDNTTSKTSDNINVVEGTREWDKISDLVHDLFSDFGEIASITKTSGTYNIYDKTKAKSERGVRTSYRATDIYGNSRTFTPPDKDGKYYVIGSKDTVNALGTYKEYKKAIESVYNLKIKLSKLDESKRDLRDVEKLNQAQNHMIELQEKLILIESMGLGIEKERASVNAILEANQNQYSKVENSLSQFDSYQSNELENAYESLIKIESQYQLLDVQINKLGDTNPNKILKLDQLENYRQSLLQIIEAEEKDKELTQSEIDIKNRYIDAQINASNAANQFIVATYKDELTKEIKNAQKMLASNKYVDSSNALLSRSVTDATQAILSGDINAIFDSIDILKDAESNAEKRGNVTKLKANLEDIQTVLTKNTAMSKQMRKEFERMFDYGSQLQTSGDFTVEQGKKFNNELIQLETQMKKTKQTGLSVWDTFTRSLRGTSIHLASYVLSWYRLLGYLRQGVSEVVNLDKALTTMSYTMDVTSKQLESMGNDIVSTAKELSTSIENISQIYQIYANMQTTAEEISKIGQPTAILANISSVDASTAADQIQGVINQFNMTAEDASHIVDVYDYISANIPVDYSKGIQGMSAAVQKVGNFAYQAGLSFEQLGAIVGRVMAQTRQDGESIGNALRTIMVRASKATNLADDGEVDNATLSDASKALKKIGIDVYNASGEFREFDVIMTELAGKWDELSDAEQANISFALAATRQTSTLRAILDNWTESMSLASDATNTNGNAVKNQQKWVESLSGRLQSLKTDVAALFIDIVNSDTIATILDALQTTVNSVDRIGTNLAPILNALAQIVGYAIKIIGIFPEGFIGAFVGVKKIPQLVNTFKLVENFFNQLNAYGKNEGVILKDVADTFRFIPDEIQNTVLAQMRLNDADKEAFGALAGLNQQQIQLIGSKVTDISMTEGQTAATDAYTTSTNLAAMGVTKLKIALGATMVALTLIVTIYNKIKQSQDEARKSAIQYDNEIKQIAKDYQSLIDKYAELKQKIDDENLSSEETYNLKTQIYDIQKQITEQYSASAKNIDLINGKLSKQTRILQDNYKQELKNNALESNSRNTTYKSDKNDVNKRYTVKLSPQGQYAELTKSFFQKYGIAPVTSISKGGAQSTYFSITGTAQELDKLLTEMWQDLETNGIASTSDANIQDVTKSLQDQLDTNIQENSERLNALEDKIQNVKNYEQNYVIYTDELYAIYDDISNQVNDLQEMLIDGTGNGIQEDTAYQELRSSIDSYIKANAFGDYQYIFEDLYKNILDTAPSQINDLKFHDIVKRGLLDTVKSEVEKLDIDKFNLEQILLNSIDDSVMSPITSNDADIRNAVASIFAQSNLPYEAINTYAFEIAQYVFSSTSEYLGSLGEWFEGSSNLGNLGTNVDVLEKFKSEVSSLVQLMDSARNSSEGIVYWSDVVSQTLGKDSLFSSLDLDQMFNDESISNFNASSDKFIEEVVNHFYEEFIGKWDMSFLSDESRDTLLSDLYNFVQTSIGNSSANELKKAADGYMVLSQTLVKLQNGYKLTSDEISELTRMFNISNDAISLTNDGYSIQEETLGSLLKSQKELTQARYDDYVAQQNIIKMQVEAYQRQFQYLTKEGRDAVQSKIDELTTRIDDSAVDYAKRVIDATYSLYTTQIEYENLIVSSTQKTYDARLTSINKLIDLYALQFQAEIDAAKGDESKVYTIREQWAQKEIELQQQRAELEKEQRDAVLREIESESRRINDAITVAESKGLVVRAQLYKDLIDNQQDLIKHQTTELSKLTELQNQVDANTAQWNEYQQQIDDANSSIAEYTKNIIDYSKSIKQLNDDYLTQQHELLSDINNEIESYITLLGRHERLFEDSGIWTGNAWGTAKLRLTEYYVALEDANLYDEQYQNAQKEYLDALENGEFNKEAQDAMENASSAARQSRMDAIQAKDAIIDLIQNGYDKQLESLKKITDEYENALDAEKDLYDYQKSVQNKTKAITNLRKQMTAYANDTSEEAKAKIQQLQVSLAEAESDLEDTQQDKYLSDTKEILTTLYDNYEEFLDSQIKDVDARISEISDALNVNQEKISSAIKDASDESEINFSETLSNIWNDTNGWSDIKNYIGKSQLDLDAFLQQLEISSDVNDIDQSTQTLRGSVDSIVTEITSISNDIEQSAQTLQEDIGKVGTGISNVSDNIKQSSQTLKTSIDGVDTNLSNISDSLTVIANGETTDGMLKKGKSFAQAFADADVVSVYVGDTKVDVDVAPPNVDVQVESNIDETMVRQIVSDAITSSNVTLPKIQKGTTKFTPISAYATGAKSIDNDELAWTQEQGMEAIIRKSDGAILTPLKRGDSVLTADMTENIWKMAENPMQFIRDNTGFGRVIMSGQPNTSVNSTMNMELVLPNVTNYEQFVNSLQSDKRFEKMIQNMTINKLNTNNTNSKYSQRF